MVGEKGKRPEPRYPSPTRSRGSGSLFTGFSLLKSDAGSGDGSPGIRFAVLQNRRGDSREGERELREGPPLGGPSKLSVDVSSTWRRLRESTPRLHLLVIVRHKIVQEDLALDCAPCPFAFYHPPMLDAKRF